MQNKEIEVKFFDRFSDKPYEVFKEITYERFINIFYSIANLKNDEQIVEIGCGSFTKRMIGKFKNVKILGVDISSNCIEYARRNIRDANFIVADCENTNLPNDFCDIVFGVISYIIFLTSQNLSKNLLEF